MMDPGYTGVRARVGFELQPERVFSDDHQLLEGDDTRITASLVQGGMRAVLESSNFLTGRRPSRWSSCRRAGGGHHARGRYDGDAEPERRIDNITSSLSDITTKLDRIPFDEIGKNLNDALHR